ncbi:LysE/ArgO family amino acid transporter [Georgenia alba]|uniref:LysE/ArgO family amino acid transporter n=1 Tax=Georgenia alba TaxID=2233858 RepID=A0ABW2QC04_9MICO
MPVVVTGLLTGLSIIVAIGAQNAYLLRQGLTRNHVAIVITICVLSDMLLIGLGVAGVGSLVRQHPAAVTVVTWLGVAYLAGYGLVSLWRARRPGRLEAASGHRASRRTVVTTTLALTYLNPHLYLDILLLGSIATTYGDDRWWFAGGVWLGSLLWFTGVGLGAHAAAPHLARPGTWRVLDVLIGLVMLGLAIRLALP